MIIKQGEAATTSSGGGSGMSGLLNSLAGQYFGGRRVAEIRNNIKDRATAEELKRFDRRQRQANKFATGVGVLSAVNSFGRNLADAKFKPISAANAGVGAAISAGSLAAPGMAELEGRKIRRRINANLSPRSGSETASSTYVDPAAEYKTVDPSMLNEERDGVTRRATPAERKKFNLHQGQRTFDMSTTGGLPDLKPEVKEPTRTMPENMVNVLASNAAPPTNLNQFTEKDLVKVINRDDAEDAREDKKLNATNLDGSKQIQGNV